jgi:hypothetical protein
MTKRRTRRAAPRKNPSHLKGPAELTRKLRGDLYRHDKLFGRDHGRCKGVRGTFACGSLSKLAHAWETRKINAGTLAQRLMAVSDYHRARGNDQKATTAMDLADLALKVRTAGCSTKDARGAVTAGRRLLAASHGKGVLSRVTLRDKRRAKLGLKVKRGVAKLPRRGAGGKFIKVGGRSLKIAANPTKRGAKRSHAKSGARRATRRVTRRATRRSR